MILRIFILTCAVFMTPSLGTLMNLDEFSNNFEEKCFQNDDQDPFRINGQDTPLSNTLENFIAMAEKFEAANPTIDLKEELYYFIRNYIFENIRLTSTGVTQWKPEGVVLTEIEKALEDDSIRNGHMQINDVFADPEKCSLYFMISHSILEKRKEPQAYRAADFNNSFPELRNDLNPDDYYPQEIGVVAIRGTNMAVSLSKVLIGMYVGLNDNRKRDITSFQLKEGLNGDILPNDRTIDTLYTLTIADVLMMANWMYATRQGYAKNGVWESIPLGSKTRIDGFCPMVYKHQDARPAYSYSSVRGAADGLILGKVIGPIYKKKRDARLSEILRMYYSRDGIAVEQDLEFQYTSSVTFCNRRDVMRKLEENLENQMLLYGFLTAEKTKDVPTIVSRAIYNYTSERQYIYNIEDATLGSYCSTPSTLEKPEDLPRQTFLDIFVLLDSRTSEDMFQQQQLITGYLAKQMDLRYSGSRMTILVDHRINSGASASGRVELKPVVVDTFSSSCAACAVGQIAYQRSDIERDQVIVALDQLLAEREENETKLHGANGKVIVYFDYDSDEVRDNNRVQGRLDKALRDLHLHHLDMLMYGVGLNMEVLKKFVRNEPSLIHLASDGTETEVAEKLARKIANAPGLLQYSDCEEGKSEASAVYENFISPMTLQHWVMPAKYFYKSRNLKVMFESPNAVINVCHNRVTMKPEHEARNCMNTTNINRIEFKLSNPCKSFSKVTCSPFYFTVMGIRNTKDVNTNNAPKEYCNDNNGQWCNTLDGIKFKVLHEGIRCSGCLGLGAVPSIIFFTLLLTYLLHKNL